MAAEVVAAAEAADAVAAAGGACYRERRSKLRIGHEIRQLCSPLHDWSDALDTAHLSHHAPADPQSAGSQGTPQGIAQTRPPAAAATAVAEAMGAAVEAMAAAAAVRTPANPARSNHDRGLQDPKVGRRRATYSTLTCALPALDNGLT